MSESKFNLLKFLASFFSWKAILPFIFLSFILIPIVFNANREGKRDELKNFSFSQYTSKPYPYGGRWPIVVYPGAMLMVHFHPSARKAVEIANAETVSRLHLKKRIFYYAASYAMAAIMVRKLGPFAIPVPIRAVPSESSVGDCARFSNGDDQNVALGNCPDVIAWTSPSVSKLTLVLLGSPVFFCQEKWIAKDLTLGSKCAESLSGTPENEFKHELYHIAFFSERHLKWGCNAMCESSRSVGELSHHEVNIINKYIMPAMRLRGY